MSEKEHKPAAGEPIRDARVLGLPKVLILGLQHMFAMFGATVLVPILVNAYGLPLDSRADYTKSDWICWTAALTQDKALRQALLSPIARMLRETTSRVPFSDWYDTKTGRYQAFIARSVQGGIYAPLLRG